MKMDSLPLVRLVGSLVLVMFAAGFEYPPDAHATPVPIYGAPHGVLPTQYRATSQSTDSIAVNDSGLVVSNLGKYLYDPQFGAEVWLGSRAVVWDATGDYEERALDASLSVAASSFASAISNDGTVFGSGSRNDTTNSGGAVRWDAAGNAVVLTLPIGFTSGVALAVNDAGAIVGQSDKLLSVSPPVVHSGKWAIRWDSAGVPTELGHLGATPEGNAFSNALAINDAGVVVGVSNRITPAGDDLGPRAVRWNAGETAATELGSLGTRTDGFTQTEAIDINDAGTVIGHADKYDRAGNYLGPSAVRWDASQNAATELRQLGEHPEGLVAGRALAINATGTIAGSAAKFQFDGSSSGSYAVLWTNSSTTATELGNLGANAFGRVDARAIDINDSGTAVGTANAPGKPGFNTEDMRAVYFRREDGDAVDLNSLIDPASGWLLLSAESISNTGWIAGVGLWNPGGPFDGIEKAYPRHFLIHVPAAGVPEPAALVLFAFAIAALLPRRQAFNGPSADARPGRAALKQR